MVEKTVYVPRVLICGSVEEFRRVMGDKPAQVVGQVTTAVENDDTNFFYDGHPLTDGELKQLLDGTAEFLLFTDALILHFFREKFSLNFQVMPAETFARKNFDGFHTNKIFLDLKDFLEYMKFSGRVLDFDRCVAKSDFRASFDFPVTIDCVEENFGGELRPIMRNVYAEIYDTFDECRYRSFDLLVLTRERTPEEFTDVLVATDAISEKILAFARHGSALERWLKESEKFFAQCKSFPTANGAWFMLKKFMPPTDLRVYVVTHKDAEISSLPNGYQFIHAGHAQAEEDFGYNGDDTGDNISRLNSFLDEVTALYWIWKNTAHTHTGFVHYRRFLTLDPTQKTFDAEKILSAKEILQLLRDYDIITMKEGLTDRTQREMLIRSTGNPDFIYAGETIIRKHLAHAHPDYVDAFDEMMDGFTLFMCGIHIARRDVFNAWCEWLFSFIIDATIEFNNRIVLGETPFAELPHVYSRLPSFFCERLFTVWLTKSHLRIKPLTAMFREGI